MGLFDGFIRRRRLKSVLAEISALRKATIGDILTKYVITVRSDDSVVKAATKMIAEDVSCVIVMDGEELKGILSERDYLHKVPLNKKVFAMQVKNIMAPSVVTVPPELTLPEAVKLMKEKHFRRLVVVKDGKVLGIVTQTDFARKIAQIFSIYPVSDALSVNKAMREAVIVSPKETFSRARDKMKKADLGAAIIVERKKSGDVISGLFSEYDVLMQFYDQHGQLKIKELSSFTTKYVRAIMPKMNVFEANRLLLQKKVHRMPVLENGKIVGMLTQTALIRFLYLNLETVLEEAKKKEAKIVAFPQSTPFEGQFNGDHLKIYPSLS